MTLQPPHGRLVAWLTLFAGLLMQIAPLPNAVEPWRPDWLLMVLIYWTMALPHRYNIFTAWILGVALDVLMGSALGVRALGFSLVIYIVAMLFQRIRNFTIWQQSLLVAGLIGLYHAVVYWLQYVLVKASYSVEIFYPMISSLIIWPWVFWILRRLRHTYKVR